MIPQHTKTAAISRITIRQSEPAFKGRNSSIWLLLKTVSEFRVRSDVTWPSSRSSWVIYPFTSLWFSVYFQPPSHCIPPGCLLSLFHIFKITLLLCNPATLLHFCWFFTAYTVDWEMPHVSFEGSFQSILVARLSLTAFSSPLSSWPTEFSPNPAFADSLMTNLW